MASGAALAMLIYLDIKIPHLQIAHLGGNLDVGNIKIYSLDYQQSKGIVLLFNKYLSSGSTNPP